MTTTLPTTVELPGYEYQATPFASQAEATKAAITALEADPDKYEDGKAVSFWVAALQRRAWFARMYRFDCEREYL